MKKYILLILLFVISFLLLFHFPYEVFMDEFVGFADGMKLYSEGHFSRGYFCHGIINPYIAEVSAYAAGVEGSFELSRIINGVIGILTILATYLLAQEIFDEKTAILSGIFLLSSPYFVISSHRLLSDNPATLFFTLSLAAFAGYWEKQEYKYFLLFSFFYGISLAAKLTALPLLAPVVLLIFFQSKFKFKEFAQKKLSFLMLAGITFLGIFPHVLIHFNYFLKDVFFYEFFRIDKGIDADPFLSGITKTPFSGYKFYISELSAIGFHQFILLLLLAGIFCWSIMLFRGRNNYDEQKKLILMIPLTFSFFFFGMLNNSYLRYIMPVFPLIAVTSAGFFFHILRLNNPTFKSPLRIFKVVISLITVVSLGLNFSLILKINEVKKRRVEFFDLGKSLKKHSQKGDVISFDFLQGANFDSSLFGEPYGAYPLMMTGIDKSIRLLNPLITPSPSVKSTIIVTSDRKSPDESFLLIDEIKTAQKLKNEIINIEFKSMGRYDYLLKEAPYYVEEVSHFFKKRGGGYPEKFFIYRRK